MATARSMESLDFLRDKCFLDDCLCIVNAEPRIAGREEMISRRLLFLPS